MKKIVLFLCLIISLQVYSQPERFRRLNVKQQLKKLIYTQTVVMPGDSLSTVYFLYKAPYQNIVFLKNYNRYSAGIRLSIEIADTNSNFIKREIKDWKIEAASFDQTTSADFFAEGFIKLKLPEGSYNVGSIVTDKNSQKEYKLGNYRFEVEGQKPIEPLIIDSKRVSCEGTNFYKLTNLDGDIPFGPANRDILISIKDLSIEEIDVAIVSDKDTLIKKSLSNSFVSSIALSECSGYIVVTDDKGLETRNFILPEISSKLKEGPFSIIVNGNVDEQFTKTVFWYDKPFSLRNPELSIEVLKYIEDETVVDSLLDMKEEDYYKHLVDFWKKMDPTPETEFNELMEEYYQRVDYVQSNFSSITGKKGLDTDRGMIFIRFGEPSKIERGSNEKGKVVETWIYENPERKYVFVDKNGVGEFSLES
jgi:GWxTD domain-containing protein